MVEFSHKYLKIEQTHKISDQKSYNMRVRQLLWKTIRLSSRHISEYKTVEERP